ncbi:uncharacterized protein LODBEIA_P28360 [Lodderomyces beijingensis]|uniref:PDZ GRASP-type domain-containing protein n=1 Tax=Lodderomyces beijingensis TaxID=1775926 RepID=A0ABP0ZQV7_9ASCO
MFSFAKKLVDRLEGHATQATADDQYFKNATQINNRGYGLRVLNVVPHSVAHEKGIESWFDYIIKINNHELPMLHALSAYAYTINDDGSISYGGGITSEQAAAVNVELLNKELTTLAQHQQELVLDVWNAKGGVVRQVSVQLELEDTLKSIGLTVESQHLSTATYVWRILNTHPGSPAFRSQLVPYSDFIIGCDSAFPTDSAKGLLLHRGESILSQTVSSYYNHHFAHSGEDNVPITLFVYNHDYDILRPVTVNLSRNWGTGHNRGILGCDVGYGLMHRIPEVIGKFDDNSVIDDVLFVSEKNIEYQFDQQPQESLTTAPPPLGASNVLSAQQQQQQQQQSLPPPPQAPPVMGSSSSPSSSAATPHKAARKKKHVAALADDGLNDYMNEELEKSKKIDNSTKPKTSGDASLSPPPPPPPPPPSKSS